MRTLQFQEITKDPARDSDWSDSVYQGDVVESFMEQEERELKAGWRSNLRYRWRPEDSPQLSTEG